MSPGLPVWASMGPRLSGRGKATAIRTRAMEIRLQWGRDLVVAESGRRDEGNLIYQWLQWGRDLVVAESMFHP